MYSAIKGACTPDGDFVKKHDIGLNIPDHLEMAGVGW
jgi:hypothetical protein